MQKTNDITSVQNTFHYLYTSSSCVETGVTGKKYFYLEFELGSSKSLSGGNIASV